MKQNLRRLFLFSFLLVSAQMVFAQEKEIKGPLTSKADGFPLSGVNGIVKGTYNGAQRDFDGEYELMVYVDDILNFSYLNDPDTDGAR